MNEYAGLTSEARKQITSFLESGDAGWEITSKRFGAGAWFSTLGWVSTEFDIPTLRILRRDDKVFIVNLAYLPVGRDDEGEVIT